MIEKEDLLRENEALRRKLAEAQRAIEALTSGNVDAPAHDGAATPRRVLAAEEARTRSEQRFASIFRLSPIAMSISTVAEGRYLDANNSFLRLFGFERDELCGHRTAELGIWTDPQDRERLVATVSHAGTVTDFEVTCRTKLGELRNVLISTEHIDIEGELCFLGIVVDITDRKRASGAVLASEKKYRQIVATAREGIWLLDRENRTSFVNRALEEMLGFEPGGMLGKSVFEFMDEESRAAALRGGWQSPGRVAARLDVKYTRKDGGVVWTQLVTSPLVDDAGSYEGALAMVTDISERKRSEKKLEEYVSLLMATLDATADGILATDRDGRVVSYNQKLVHFFGVPEDVRAGPVERRLAFLLGLTRDPEEQAARMRAIYARVDQESEDLVELVDGRTFERRSQPQWISGVCVGRVWSFRDVTQQRQMHVRLLAADRLSSMGALAAGVAHEINNPLAYVMVNLGLLADELPQIASVLGRARVEEVSECLSDAREGAERVRRIVRDLKVFSRSEEVENGAVDLERLLEFAVNMAANEIRHRAKLVKDYGKIPLVEGNEGRLGQVFLNLIVNAAQSIGEGSAERNEIRIVTRTTATGGVMVEVHDTGAGIPKEQLKQIFVPFFTTKPVGTGTGLGLSISYTIIEALGGEISVESEVGKGTVFRVLLRAAGLDRMGRPVSRPAPVIGLYRGEVLVIDDDELVGVGLRRLLGREHAVTLMTSGRAGLEHLASGAPVDVILCDLMMPDMTGMDVYEELFRINPRQAAKMIFITGGAFTARARQFLDDVPNARLAKPFDPPSLRALIRRAVHG